MKTLRFAFALSLLSLLGCFDRGTNPTPPPPPQPSINVSCIGDGACSGGPGTTPQPGVAQECSQIGRVVVKILFDGDRTTLAVGERPNLDATAYNAISGNQVFTLCPVVWRLDTTPFGACELEGDLSGYTPKIRAVKLGSCTAGATVGNGSGSRLFTVQ